MASRQGFLVNNTDPSKVLSSGVDVREGAVRITCSGMGVPGAAWQVRVGTPQVGSWQDVVRFGVPIILSDNNTQYVEVVAGQYRIAPIVLPQNAQVFFQEDEETDHDAKTMYIFGQENTNQNGITAGSSASIDVHGNGTVAAPLGMAVKYSNSACNLAHAGMDGAIEAVLSVGNTATVNFTGCGATGSPVEALVNVSADVGNTTIAKVDGIFSKTYISGTETTTVSGDGTEGSPYSITYAPAPVTVSTADTPTLAITGNGSPTSPLSGAVKLSAAAGNAVSAVADGLFVAPAPSTALSTVSTGTVTLSGAGTLAAPLNATVGLSAAAGNQVVAHADGLYVAPAASSVTGNLTALAGATPTADVSAATFFTIALSSNATLSITNPPATGQAETVAFRIQQDGTGGWTLTLPTNFHATSGSDTLVQVTANASTMLAATTFDQGITWVYTMKGVV